MLAGPPDPGTPAPPAVVEVAGGRTTRPVWRNELGGLTYEVGAGAGRCFVKWAPPGTVDLEAEAVRIEWLRTHSPAPRVLDLGGDSRSGGSWLVTEALPGESAVSDRWRRDPGTAVAAIGAGLRHLHDHAPEAACPYSWSVEDRVAEARALTSVAPSATWRPEHRGLTTTDALATLDDPPPVDEPVVCHGDACAPNTIVDEGRWSGHVDLGTLGVADRWADLSIATWSTEWNYGPGWERPLLDAYGTEPDPERAAYYRLLWDLSP